MKEGSGRDRNVCPCQLQNCAIPGMTAYGLTFPQNKPLMSATGVYTFLPSFADPCIKHMKTGDWSSTAVSDPSSERKLYRHGMRIIVVILLCSIALASAGDTPGATPVHEAFHSAPESEIATTESSGEEEGPAADDSKEPEVVEVVDVPEESTVEPPEEPKTGSSTVHNYVVRGKLVCEDTWKWGPKLVMDKGEWVNRVTANEETFIYVHTATKTKKSFVGEEKPAFPKDPIGRRKGIAEDGQFQLTGTTDLPLHIGIKLVIYIGCGTASLSDHLRYEKKFPGVEEAEGQFVYDLGEITLSRKAKPKPKKISNLEAKIDRIDKTRTNKAVAAMKVADTADKKCRDALKKRIENIPNAASSGESEKSESSKKGKHNFNPFRRKAAKDPQTELNQLMEKASQSRARATRLSQWAKMMNSWQHE